MDALPGGSPRDHAGRQPHDPLLVVIDIEGTVLPYHRYHVDAVPVAADVARRRPALTSAAVLLVGLTGGIGSGKSTVSALLAARGAVVIDADAVVRDLQRPGTAVYDAMVERFGPGIVAPDGTLDRDAVADIVFTDAEALADLNRIVHPAVGAEILRRLAELAPTDAVVVLDVPLLVESTRDYPMAGVIVVDVDPDIAVERLVMRGMREADARARMAQQASREERRARADVVIDNRGTFDDLARKVDAVWDWIEDLRAGAA